MPDAYALSEDDVMLLRLMAKSYRDQQGGPGGSGKTLNRPSLPYDTLLPPGNVYLAVTPAGGLPASSSSNPVGATLGSASCSIYQLVNSGGTITLNAVYSSSQTVYNYTTTSVAASTMVLVAKDNYGQWFVTGVAGGGGSSQYAYTATQESGTYPNFSATSISTLSVNGANGLYLTSGGTFGILLASSTLAGTVSTTTQSFQGEKTFLNKIDIKTTGQSGDLLIDYRSLTFEGQGTSVTLSVTGVDTSAIGTDAGYTLTFLVSNADPIPTLIFGNENSTTWLEMCSVDNPYIYTIGSETADIYGFFAVDQDNLSCLSGDDIIQYGEGSDGYLSYMGISGPGINFSSNIGSSLCCVFGAYGGSPSTAETHAGMALGLVPYYAKTGGHNIQSLSLVNGVYNTSFPSANLAYLCAPGFQCIPGTGQSDLVSGIGQTGTDAIGNSFTGGIITTIGTGGTETQFGAGLFFTYGSSSTPTTGQCYLVSNTSLKMYDVDRNGINLTSVLTRLASNFSSMTFMMSNGTRYCYFSASLAATAGGIVTWTISELSSSPSFSAGDNISISW